jgi:leader peptidase (prepilin peptidase)/N-methyltransferase
LLAGLANLGLPLTELTASHLGRQMLPVLDSVLGSLLGGGFLFLAAWAGKRAFKQDAMGGGDIKLALMIGAFLGWKGVVIALFLSFLAGSLVSLALMALGRIKGKRAIVPFGPFLAIGSILTLWAGDAVITWYLHMLFGT